eukprot:scaffold15585_cov162-Skeletonema_menzelii.AAC.7
MVCQCSVCGKDGASKRCSRCKSSSYVVCNVECQRSDWKRHKREECLVVTVEDGMPAEECSCHRCKAGLTDIGDDDVSDFFNDLHMVRGRKGVWRIIDGKEDELDIVAYPYQRFIHVGSFALFAVPEPKTFYTSNDKGFTVGQLAEAMAKAEEGNIGKYNEIGAAGGGWYFEGYTRGKDPHSFIVSWGSKTSSNRVGVGIGLNHINTRAYAAAGKK